jgi:hypothetical protein
MNRLLNNQEVAEILGISPFSWRSKVLRREVLFVKIGRRTLFDPADLGALIEARKVKPRREVAE